MSTAVACILVLAAWPILGCLGALVVGAVLARGSGWPISEGVLAEHDRAWEDEFNGDLPAVLDPYGHHAVSRIPAQRTEGPYDGLAVEELYRDIEAFEGGTDL